MIVFTGLSGSGKSVQGLMLSKTLGYEWISVGEMLRESLTGKEREKMLHGSIVRDDISIGLLEPRLKSAETSNIILDGFPRTVFETKWLIDMHKNQHTNLEYVFHLITTREVSMNRLLKRGRIDDQEEVINKRFSEYEKAITPIMEHFKASKIPCFEINGNQATNLVHKDIMGIIKK